LRGRILGRRSFDEWKAGENGGFRDIKNGLEEEWKWRGAVTLQNIVKCIKFQREMDGRNELVVLKAAVLRALMK
jgi:hypothetical protein